MSRFLVLLAALSADDFHLREEATRELAACPAPIRALFPAMSRRAVDPEVRWRLREAYEQGLTNEIQSLGQPLPMIDALWYDAHSGCYNHRSVPFGLVLRSCFEPYIDMARRRDSLTFQTYGAATGLAVRDLIGSGVPATCLKPVIDVMRRRDAHWLSGPGQASSR